MKFPLSEYRSIVFDCDGVLLNSNKIKTDAFYQVVEAYFPGFGEAFVKYHTLNGGVSRYVKFRFLVEEIIDKTECVESRDRMITKLCDEYERIIKSGLLTCEAAESLEALKSAADTSNWFVISGGDQAELRDIFLQRGLSKLFNGGIYGAPEDKVNIALRLKNDGVISGASLVFGDNRKDFEMARAIGADFIFVRQWSEMVDFKEFIEVNRLLSIHSLASLLEQ